MPKSARTTRKRSSSAADSEEQLPRCVLARGGIETIVLERGIRWPITTAGDTFCTKENPDGRAAWLSSTTILPDPLPKFPIDVFTGVLDRKIGNGVIVYRGAGVGGGSLMYGGITYQPIKEF